MYKFKLKGNKPLHYHLGCDFGRNEQGELYQSPKTYIKRVIDNYTQLFGEQPKHYKSPLEKNDHPELDDTEFLDPEEIKLYQSLIGSLQWAISLGRFDIQVAVMSLSSFRVAPRQGHLMRAKRIIGYLAKYPSGMIRYLTDRPDLSDLEPTQYDWDGTPYQDFPDEDIEGNLPEPKGRTVDTISYFDASLYFDLSSGKGVTGCLHLLNKTAIDWHCRKQRVPNTSTFGAEIDAARTCTQQIIDLRITLRYMGVPIGRSVMFGDSKSVVDNTTIPKSKNTKRHTALSYHCVRDAIYKNVMSLFHIPGTHNPADMLSKNWGMNVVWDKVKPMLFWNGDTMDLICDDKEATKITSSRDKQ